VFEFCLLPINDEEVKKIIQEHEFDKMKARRQHADESARIHEGFYRKGKAGTWQKELSTLDRYTFDKLAGDLLFELDYADHGWWSESKFQRLMLPYLDKLFTTASWIHNIAFIVNQIIKKERTIPTYKSNS
jgi:hypothetical protein